MFRAQSVHRLLLRSLRSAGFHAPVDQDRRLPGGLRLLPAERRVTRPACSARKCCRSTVWPRRARRRQAGATRFCMGAAWREPKERDLDKVCDMVAAVHALGLETCVTLGMLTQPQARAAKTPGSTTTTTTSTPRPSSTARSSARGPIRTGSTRSRTCARRGIEVCCGGIIGMGETVDDRVGLLADARQSRPAHPESVPINMLVAGRGHAA